MTRNGTNMHKRVRTQRCVRRYSFNAGCAAALAIIALQASAAPREATTFLMNEPVTLLDWGTYKLERFLERRRWPQEFEPTVFTKVSYDWDRDRIVIDVQALVKFGPPTRDQCLGVLKLLLSAGGVVFETRNRQLNDGISTFAVEFLHMNFRSPNQPPDLGKKIDEVLELRVTVSGLPSGGQVRQVECRTNLTNPEVVYIER